VTVDKDRGKDDRGDGQQKRRSYQQTGTRQSLNREDTEDERDAGTSPDECRQRRSGEYKF
jgi:hypothetical protein